MSAHGVKLGPIIFIIFIILFSSIPVRAKVGAQFYLNVGMMSNDLSVLNSKLNEFGYITISNTKLRLGYGNDLIIKKKWIIGFDFDIFTGSGLAEGGSCGYSGGAFALSCGYLLFAKGEWFAYPEIGFGMRSVGLSLSRIVDEIEFGDILTDPGRSASLRCENGITRVGFTVNRKFSNKPADLSFFVGFSLGYDIAGGTPRWTADYNEGNNGPDLYQGGYYVRISAGVLYLEKKGDESR
jgi:hypothetical protein